jgi:hypothetical protein
MVVNIFSTRNFIDSSMVMACERISLPLSGKRRLHPGKENKNNVIFFAFHLICTIFASLFEIHFIQHNDEICDSPMDIHRGIDGRAFLTGHGTRREQHPRF